MNLIGKIASISLLASLALSFTAELWSNNKPIVARYHNKWYFPIFKNANIPWKSAEAAIWPLNAWDPFESNLEVAQFPSPPSWHNWLGTDDRGRDLLARIIYGLRYSLVFSIGVWTTTLILGAILGGVMGYCGGIVDLIGQRIVEVFECFPQLPLLLIVMSFLRPQMMLLICMTSLFGWTSVCQYFRVEFLRLRRLDFIAAARLSGASHASIIWQHFLPNSIGPALTAAPMAMAGHIVTLSVLDFLGFGFPPPTPSWGELLNEGYQYFTTAWWLVLFPTLALFKILVLLHTISQSVRQGVRSSRS